MRVVEFIDIYPTLMSLSGIQPPKHLAGRDLTPIVNDPLGQWDDFAITQVLRPADSRLDTPVMGCSIRTKRWRYTEWAEGTKGTELYDHHADPQEFENLAEQDNPIIQKTIQELRKKLRQHASGKIPNSPFNPARL